MIAFAGRIPRDALNAGNGFSRLEFAVDQAFTPRNLSPNYDDERTIAAYFWWIEIYPA